MTTIPCGVCDAPCHPGREHDVHESACLSIAVGLSSDPSAELSDYCRRIAYEDRLQAFQRNAMNNMPAWSPDTVMEGGSLPIPDHLARMQADPEVKPTEREDPYGYYSGRKPTAQALPPGKVRCHHCNGLQQMYPDCVNCDGKGWV